MNIYAILMAGGVGARFWPRSRQKTPKQVLNIVGKKTMIQATYERLNGITESSSIKVVTNEDQAKLIKAQLPDLTNENFYIEPVGRNTAPCIGLAAIHIAAQDPDGIMVVLPADHVITKVNEFQTIIRLGIEFVEKHDGLVTLGITPSEPATGYGYIQSGEEIYKQGTNTVHKVQTFAEKPNWETANRFLESGDFFWNSGIFIWKASTILNEINDKLPDVYEPLMTINNSIDTPEYQQILSDMYGRIPSISVDFGVMQKAEKVFVIPADMGWNDVGSWETVYEISPKDKNLNSGNFHEIINIDSRECYVYSPQKVIALVGVEDLIVVDTGDALLVCDKNAAQDVKDVVEQLKKKRLKEWL